MRDPSFYLGAATISAVLAAWLSYVFTPFARRAGLRYGAAPAPRARDVHREPIPRWGGLAIYAAFVLSLVVGALVVHFGFGRPIGGGTLRAGLALVLAGGILSVVGAIDDRYDLSAGKQMIAQVLCAAMVVQCGVKIQFISNPLGGGMVGLHQWLAFFLTVVWLVGVANAVNWIDGIDGLAAGVSAIAAVTLTLMATFTKQPALALMAAALFGSLLGFLRYNFNPAKIFMGGGAQVVGFMLAGISTVGAFKGPVAFTVVFPMLVLALPIFDTALVIFRRWRAGRPIYQADKSHLHHRLLALGFSQKQTVLILYGISFGLCIMAFVLMMSLRGG